LRGSRWEQERWRDGVLLLKAQQQKGERDKEREGGSGETAAAGVGCAGGGAEEGRADEQAHLR
jgi:hypothetical protein